MGIGTTDAASAGYITPQLIDAAKKEAEAQHVEASMPPEVSQSAHSQW